MMAATRPLECRDQSPSWPPRVLLLKCLASGLHSREQRRFREAPGRPRAFLHGVNFDHSLKLAFLKIWGQYLGGSLILDSSVGFSRDLLGRALQHLPSGLFQPWFLRCDSGQ